MDKSIRNDQSELRRIVNVYGIKDVVRYINENFDDSFDDDETDYAAVSDIMDAEEMNKRCWKPKEFNVTLNILFISHLAFGCDYYDMKYNAENQKICKDIMDKLADAITEPMSKIGLTVKITNKGRSNVLIRIFNNKMVPALHTFEQYLDILFNVGLRDGDILKHLCCQVYEDDVWAALPDAGLIDYPTTD